MDLQAHWEHIYGSKTPDEMSWYQPHLQTSLDWILEAADDPSVSIIDVGGGESTLATDLIERGYSVLTVMDISKTALLKTKERLGGDARSITWLTGDVTTSPLPSHAYDIWHDRAVFHFLTDPEQRSAYLLQLASALKPAGFVILATFGPEGPRTCSGLDTMRYDESSLQDQLGPEFRLVQSSIVEHQTPSGTRQQFLYCKFRFEPQKGTS